MSIKQTGNINNKSRKVNMRFDHDLIDDINNHKDDLIPFSAWVKAACREKLDRETTFTKENKENRKKE